MEEEGGVLLLCFVLGGLGFRVWDLEYRVFDFKAAFLLEAVGWCA